MSISRRSPPKVGCARSRPLIVERLEDRSVLSVTASFADGLLTLHVNNSQAVVLGAEYGQLTVSGYTFNQPIQAADVRNISIIGNSGDQRIDLEAVSAANFANLTSIRIDAGSGQDTIIGSQFGDWIDVGGGDNLVLGNGGDDTIASGSGQDSIEGGLGFDIISSGAGDDRVLGGEDDDSITLSNGNDFADGGAGNDTIYGGRGDDLLLGSAGDDALYGEDNHDTVEGGAGDDYLSGGDDSDRILGDAGDDAIDSDASDFVDGGAGVTEVVDPTPAAPTDPNPPASALPADPGITGLGAPIIPPGGDSGSSGGGSSNSQSGSPTGPTSNPSTSPTVFGGAPTTSGPSGSNPLSFSSAPTDRSGGGGSNLNDPGNAMTPRAFGSQPTLGESSSGHEDVGPAHRPNSGSGIKPSEPEYFTFSHFTPWNVDTMLRAIGSGDDDVDAFLGDEGSPGRREAIDHASPWLAAFRSPKAMTLISAFVPAPLGRLAAALAWVNMVSASSTATAGTMREGVRNLPPFVDRSPGSPFQDSATLSHVKSLSPRSRTDDAGRNDVVDEVLESFAEDPASRSGNGEGSVPQVVDPTVQATHVDLAIATGYSEAALSHVVSPAAASFTDRDAAFGAAVMLITVAVPMLAPCVKSALRLQTRQLGTAGGAQDVK